MITNRDEALKEVNKACVEPRGGRGLSRAARAKHHRLSGSCTTETCFLASWRPRSEIGIPARLGSGENLLLVVDR